MIEIKNSNENMQKFIQTNDFLKKKKYRFIPDTPRDLRSVIPVMAAATSHVSLLTSQQWFQYSPEQPMVL
jgi:hypothetical protein